MRRPGPVGLLLLVAFSIPVVIEVRTVLSMVGIDIPAAVFFPVAAVAVALVVVALRVLPEGEESDRPDSSEPEGPDRGNPSRT